MRQNVSEILDFSRLELWRHAKTHGDLQTWAAFQQSLEGTVLSWFHEHPGSEAVCRVNSERHFVSLADSRGMVRLLSVVNSLQRPICQRVTRRWEALSRDVSPEASVYSVSMDSPQLQASFQDMAGVLHQTLSAHRDEQFG